MRPFPTGLMLSPLALVCILPGCKPKKTAEQPHPEMAVFSVLQRDTPILVEFTGTLEASEQVDLRSKVDGFLEKQWVPDGSEVKVGQLLFTVDPKPLKTALDEARANLAKAQSSYDNARSSLTRVKGLESSQIVSRQQVDDAVASECSAASALAAAKAEVEHAQQNVSYASIKSPLDGLMGKAQIQAGALVVQGQTILATVSSDKTMQVSFGISENDYIRYVKAQVAGEFPKDPKVTLVLADGTVHPSFGHIGFVDRAMATTTASLVIKAEFPNPGHYLKPGMSAKVRFEAGQVNQAVLVPQKAVQDLLGRNFVMVVGPEGKLEQRFVTMGHKAGPFWMCNSGLKAGEQVLLEGFMQVQAGSVIRPKPVSETTLTSSIQQPK